MIEMKKVLILCVAGILASYAAAQDNTPVISGDRPGFGVSTATLPKGGFQIESGLQWDGFFQKPNTRSLGIFSNYHNIYNFTTLRYGISDKVEVKMDLSGGYYNFSRNELNSNYDYWAFQSPSIGARITLLENDNIGNLLWYGTGSLPFLNSYDGEAGFVYDTRLLYTNGICNNTTLDVNLGLTQNVVWDAVPFFHGALALTYGVCDRWSIFGEAYTYTDFVFSDNWLDGGVIFNPTPTTQLDFSVGYYLDLDRNVQYNFYRQVFANIGGAIRF